MAYTAWTVVFGETPSASKWNILGANDASFNNGTGIANNAITSTQVSGIDKSITTTDSNPYKFSVYMSANQTLSATPGAYNKLVLNTEEYDTNNNFNTTTYTYTIPVTGYYIFTGCAQLLSQAASYFIISLSKTGTTEYRRFAENPNCTGNITLSGAIEGLYTSGETISFGALSGTASKVVGGGTAQVTRFTGRLAHRS